MYMRTILFSTLMLFCCGTAIAQRPGPEFWRKVGCEPLEPRTKLEALEDRYSAVIIKGFTRITTIEMHNVRVDAVEMREMGNVSRAKGVAVVVREGAERPKQDRAFVDSIVNGTPPLVTALDGLMSVELVNAVYESIRTNATITIRPVSLVTA